MTSSLLAALALAAGCQAYDRGAYQRLLDGASRLDATDASDARVPVDALDATTVDATDATDATDARDALDATDVVVPSTLVYVFNTLTIDANADLTTPHTGFDLDGLCSDGTGSRDCSHEDFFSALDPDQNSNASCGGACHHGCVDNQMPYIVQGFIAEGSTDPRAALSDGVAANATVYILRITGVDSLSDDSDVTVSFYRGFPTFTTGCDAVAPGRTYRVARGSLVAGGTTLEDAQYRVGASIVAGRLRVDAPVEDTLPIVLPTSSIGDVPLNLSLSHIRVDLMLAAGANGNIGGRVHGGDLAMALCAMLDPDFCPLIETNIGGSVDVQVLGTCFAAGPPAQYGDIGLGLGFSLLDAVIDPVTPVADARDPGACGQSTSDGGADAGND